MKSGQDEIYNLLRNSSEPMSTKAIAEKLNIDWHTANKRLEILVKNNQIYKKRWKSNLTLYWDRPIF